MGLTWSQSPCAHLPISYGPCSTHWSPTSGEDTLPTQVAFEIQSNGKTMAQSARKELQKVLLDIAPRVSRQGTMGTSGQSSVSFPAPKENQPWTKQGPTMQLPTML